MKLTTPVALLAGLSLAGAFTGIGLFSGLRARTPAGGSASPPASTASTSQLAPTASPDADASPVDRGPVDREQVKSEIARALDAQKATLLPSCWAPSVSKSPDPAHVDYVLNFTFDAAGRQIARGMIIGDGRPPSAPPVPGARRPVVSRADVTACLGSTLAPISIAPRGRSVYVEVPFSLP